MRRWLSAAMFLWLTPVLAVGAAGFPLSPVVAVIVGLAAAAALAWPASGWLARALHTDRRLPMLLVAALAVASSVAILRIAAVGVFIADVSRVEFSVAPDDPFRRVHSCMSAYAEAARFLDEGAHNVYERDLYRPGGADRRIGALRVDPFHYPPPFLLAAQAVRAAAPDFWRFRRLWFTMQALVLAGAVVGLAAWVGGLAGLIVLFGGLVILALPHAVFTLQQGNFQITAVPLAAISFALLLSGRSAPGAAGLAFAALAKIFPGILVVPLLAARRWRSVGWVAAMGLLVLALGLVTQGVQPLRDFVSTSLPEISSGAAFPQSELPHTVRVNWSAYGQTVRLRELGVSWLTQPRGLMVSQLYGLAVVAFAVWAGWRMRFDVATRDGRIAALLLCLGLVSLASFRSPFVGAGYGGTATLWILALFAARTTGHRHASLWLAAMLALGVVTWMIPSPGQTGGRAWIWISGLLLTLSMAINVWAVAEAVRAPQATGGPEPVDRTAPAVL